MALSNLPYLKTLNPLLSPFPSKTLNANSNPNPNIISLCSPSLKEKKPFTDLKCSTSSSQGSTEFNQPLNPRPQEIPWNKELANSVHLIGIVGASVQMKQLSSGKTLAWTRIGVKKSSSESSWINLTFWDELAHVAFQHVEKGQQVYVSGRLVSDTVEGDDETRQVYYKVVVQKLNFIERSHSPVSSHVPVANSMDSGEKVWNSASNSAGPTEELWQAFFANPLDWWDNRRNKRNPRYPDFKHKDTGEALWVEGKFNPAWVKSQLAILDARMSSPEAYDHPADGVTSFYG